LQLGFSPHNNFNIMGVFVSWAIEGSLSHRMALHIKEWLPNVFVGQVECFVSSTDISAGSIWLQELFSQLERSQAGIVCVTRESMTRGWMLFEAGALAKMIGTQTQRVCPLLLDLDPGELQYPLAAFQWKVIRPDVEVNSKEQVLALVKMINESVETLKQLPEQRLLAQFNAFWPQFWKNYTEQRAIQNNATTHAPVEIGNNEILVEMRSGFRQMLNMLEREQRIEVQVECPNCGTAVVGEFYDAAGATRHFTCANCRARFISHLDSDHHARAKLLSAGFRGSAATSGPVVPPDLEALQVSCPSCSGIQVEMFPIAPGSTKHLKCIHCAEPFIAHRMSDGTSKSSQPAGGTPQPITFEEFLRKTSFWVNPDKTTGLILMACDSDQVLSQIAQTKTPTLLKKAIIEHQSQESSMVVNTFVKILLHGGAFALDPAPKQAAFYQSYTNRLVQADLLRAFYRGHVRRLRSHFSDLGEKDFSEMRSILQTATIPGADAALMEALKTSGVGNHPGQQTSISPISPKKDENPLDSAARPADDVTEG
jgi:hypothetical protein